MTGFKKRLAIPYEAVFKAKLLLTDELLAAAAAEAGEEETEIEE